MEFFYLYNYTPSWERCQAPWHKALIFKHLQRRAPPGGRCLTASCLCSTSEHLIPLLSRDARLDELAVIGVKMWESVLQEQALFVVRGELPLRDVEVTGAGGSRDGGGAGDLHIVIILQFAPSSTKISHE